VERPSPVAALTDIAEVCGRMVSRERRRGWAGRRRRGWRGSMRCGQRWKPHGGRRRINGRRAGWHPSGTNDDSRSRAITIFPIQSSRMALVNSRALVLYRRAGAERDDSLPWSSPALVAGVSHHLRRNLMFACLCSSCACAACAAGSSLSCSMVLFFSIHWPFTHALCLHIRLVRSIASKHMPSESPLELPRECCVRGSALQLLTQSQPVHVGGDIIQQTERQFCSDR
jgi:hypothetical protein